MGDTTHKEEVPAETVRKLFDLFNNLVAALEARGNADYSDKLRKIPADYHHKLNYILQYMAQVCGVSPWSSLSESFQFILTMFEVRRGAKNLTTLKKADFQLKSDKVYDFQFWKKVCQLVFGSIM